MIEFGQCFSLETWLMSRETVSRTERLFQRSYSLKIEVGAFRGTIKDSSPEYLNEGRRDGGNDGPSPTFAGTPC